MKKKLTVILTCVAAIGFFLPGVAGTPCEHIEEQIGAEAEEGDLEGAQAWTEIYKTLGCNE